MQDGSLFPQPLSPQDARLKNPLALAFIGDTVWDLLVRSRLLRYPHRVNTLHRQAIALVNAGAQAQALARLLPLLSQEEADVLRRGQNAHARHMVPKNQDPVAYSQATGLEALLGYLYLSGQEARILELFDIAVPMP